MAYDEVIEKGDIVEFSGEYYCQGKRKFVWSTSFESGIVVDVKYEVSIPIEDTPSRIVTILSSDKQLIDLYADKTYTAIRKVLSVNHE